MDQSVQEQHTCKNCGNVFTGVYCNLCGEKVLQVQDRKFKSFLGSILVAVTFADNKVIQTLWLVIRRPGFLSKEYINGIRVKYIKPLQLFFILNLVYFLFPVFQLFNSSLYTQMYLLPHRQMARSLVLHKLTTTNISLQAYTLMYDAKSQSLAKLLIVLFIFFASLPLSLIFRKKKIFFTDHTTLAVELAIFNIAVNAILLNLIFWTLNTAFNWSGSGLIKYLDDFAITTIFIGSNLYFLWRASRTFYGEKKRMLSFKVPLALVGLYAALELYRLMLFFITYWST